MNRDKTISDLRNAIENAQKLLSELTETQERPDFVVINGLKWDRENTVVKDREHFCHEEAPNLAQTNDKRLPTPEEWEALIALGSTWDEDKKGRWFGNDHELKADSKESIFLPAAGYRSSSSGALGSRGYSGYYWSTRMSSDTNAYALNFHSSSTYMYNTYRSFGFSVRCVADINS